MAKQPSREHAQAKATGAVSRSPLRLFTIVAISIMVTEIAIMFLLDQLPPLSPLERNVVDGVLLVILLLPVLYLFLFRPLRIHTARLQRMEGPIRSQNGEEVEAWGSISRFPAKLLFVVAISIMVAEIDIMFLFEGLPPMLPLVENLADGVLLTIVLSPILYLFLFRPMSVHVSALDEAEKSLRQQNEELREKSRQLLAAQEELVRKETLALLGQVADTVGHELRNPLGVMNNAVYFLQSVLAGADETTKEYLGIIKDEVADAERIVSDLLDAVRTKPPHPRDVRLAEEIKQTLHKCGAPSSVVVHLDIPPTLPSLRVDPMHLHQVLWNLVVNAVEAMPQGGLLEISAAVTQGKAVRISVKDGGSGIAPEQQARLFQPLFTTKARRIGLGLVVVKNLVQANGGSVGVESEPGKGSTFFIVLPCGNDGAGPNRQGERQ